jgi:cytochrome c peroxidase
MQRAVWGLIVVGVLSCQAVWSQTAHHAPALESYAVPDAIPYPDDNPYSKAKADLGQTLFFDPILSKSRTIACVSCHQPALGWGDGRARATGEAHTPMAFRSPTLIDVAWTERLGWDGKFRDLESVAFTPITATANMNLPEQELTARLSAAPAYAAAFSAAFGDPAVTRRRIELALATYERSIVAKNAPFDRWVEGDASAIDVAAKRGFDLFNGKAHCSACHSGWAFTDGSFHDIGTATGDDIGRGRLFPTSVKLRYAFKTPSLRDVARRAPYMHDGSVPTLAAVIDLYDKGGITRPSRSEAIRPLGLSETEKADLLAFLDTLTDAPPPSSTALAR